MRFYPYFGCVEKGMNYSKFKDFFYFNKGERRGTMILGIILVVVLLLRAWGPQCIRREPSDFAKLKGIMEHYKVSMDSISALEPAHQEITSASQELRPAPFDPNTVTRESLLSMGLNTRLVNTFINYRDKGGRFYEPEHIKKIYGLDDSLYVALSSYIIIDKKGINARPDNKETVVPISEIRIMELNTVDSTDLIRLWGLGPVFSSRIIKYRNLLGGFYSLDQLKEVYGLSTEVFDTIRHFLSIDTNQIIKMNLNRVSLGHLSRHPYIDTYQARAIIDYRNFKGEFSTLNELVTEKLLSAETFSRVRHYLEIPSNTPKK